MCGRCCRGGGVCPGTRGDSGRLEEREGCPFPLTLCRDTPLHVSVCVCVHVAVYNTTSVGSVEVQAGPSRWRF